MNIYSKYTYIHSWNLNNLKRNGTPPPPPPSLQQLSPELLFWLSFLGTKGTFSTELGAKTWSLVANLCSCYLLITSLWSCSMMNESLICYNSQLYDNNSALRTNCNREWLDSRQNVHVGRKVLKYTHFRMLKRRVLLHVNVLEQRSITYWYIMFHVFAYCAIQLTENWGQGSL